MEGWLGFCFMQKLKVVKNGSKDWNRATFDNISSQKEDLAREISLLDFLEQTMGLSVTEFRHRALLKAELEDVIVKQQRRWR